MSQLKHWADFKREDLPKPHTLRVGKRWLRDGVIKGKAITNGEGEIVDILVDVYDWYGANPAGSAANSVDSAALALLS